jgi:hypothetical protein
MVIGSLSIPWVVILGLTGVVLTVLVTLAVVYRVRLRICCCQVRVRHPTPPYCMRTFNIVFINLYCCVMTVRRQHLFIMFIFLLFHNTILTHTVCT